MDAPTLKPAHEIARGNPVRFPNESAAYRQARNALLAEEIELRRHIERVAELRRALPPGGLVNDRYRFVSEQGEVSLADLFGDKATLVIYSYMFGPKRAAPCPMCTSFMSTWENKVPDVEQRVAFVFMARSPIDRLVAAKNTRGWSRICVVSDTDGGYTRDYVSREDADVPAYNVFTHKDGTIRHFCRPVRCMPAPPDPGAGSLRTRPRSAVDSPVTPPRRECGKSWYPKLELARDRLATARRAALFGRVSTKLGVNLASNKNDSQWQRTRFVSGTIRDAEAAARFYAETLCSCTRRAAPPGIPHRSPLSALTSSLCCCGTGTWRRLASARGVTGAVTRGVDGDHIRHAREITDRLEARQRVIANALGSKFDHHSPLMVTSKDAFLVGFPSRAPQNAGR
jgi:predicted dithiol-disulfide oxidoreductase (DUF899 family)